VICGLCRKCDPAAWRQGRVDTLKIVGLHTAALGVMKDNAFLLADANFQVQRVDALQNRSVLVSRVLQAKSHSTAGKSLNNTASQVISNPVCSSAQVRTCRCLSSAGGCWVSFRFQWPNNWEEGLPP